MKKIALMMMLAFLCTATVAHAIPMWIEGYVNNGEGRPIEGAKLDWNFPEGITTVYTNSLGEIVRKKCCMLEKEECQVIGNQFFC